MSCGVGCRPHSDPELLWLWSRPASTALIIPLAWKSPYVGGGALEKHRPTKCPLIMAFFFFFFVFCPFRPDPSHVCDLHHSSWQRLNTLSEARDQICNLMVPSLICFHCAMTATPIIDLNVKPKSIQCLKEN